MSTAYPRVRVRPETVEDADTVLDEICGLVDRAAVEKKTVGKEDLTLALEDLEYIAPKFGIGQQFLVDLVNMVIIKSNLDQASTNRVIRNLYPRQKVENEVVIKIVGSLGLGQTKPSLPTQGLLLRWLIMVYDFIEDLKTLGKFYDLLFGLLDMITLRPSLCHLLSIITQRKHVKPFRIQILLELKNNVGPEPALLGLLQVFKNYFPDVIVGEVGKVRAGLFAHPKPDWLRTTRLIMERYGDESGRGGGSFRVTRKFGDEGVKRRRTGGRDIIPQTFTAGAHESSITVEEIESVNDLASRFYRIELPSQLASTLSNPLLRKVVALRQPESFTSRIDNWLSAVLFEEFSLSGNMVAQKEDPSTAELLSNLLDYTRFTKALLPSVESFLREVLKTWDGRVYRDSILGLICFLNIRDFTELHQNYLGSFEKSMLADGNSDEVAAVRLLETYSGLLQRWMLDYDADAKPDTQSISAVRQFVEHAGNVCVQTLSTFDDSAAVGNAVLSFYETTATLSMRNRQFLIQLPPDSVVYRLLFTHDTMTLSRLCEILESIRKIFKEATRRDEPYPRPILDRFNGLVTDTVNCLWRNRAFSRQDKNANGCNVPESIVAGLQNVSEARDVPLSTIFNTSHASVFTTIQADVYEKHFGRPPPGPINSKLLKSEGVNMEHKEFRLQVLEECKDRGFTGFPALVHGVIL